MIEAIQLWNEPTNPAYWDRSLDPGLARFCEMIRGGAEAIHTAAPGLTRVLPGLNPFDPDLLELFRSHGVLERADAVALHGFPMDWNLWPIDDWRRQVDAVRALTDLPVWVTEAGASSFGAEEVQAFALERTSELLGGYVDRAFWSSLLDHPPTWEMNSRHREAEGSAYYRHFYLGMIGAGGTPKRSTERFDPVLGISQPFYYEDPRFDTAVEWLRRLDVRRVRTYLSWADWTRPNADLWFDRMMAALEPFAVTAVLCYTPPALGLREHHTAPPTKPAAFADFAAEMARRYAAAL